MIGSFHVWIKKIKKTYERQHNRPTTTNNKRTTSHKVFQKENLTPSTSSRSILRNSMSAAAGEKVELLECGTSLAEGEFNQEEPTGDQPSNSTLDSVQALQSLLADSVLAGNTSFKSPFELKGRFLDVPLVYCDQTASNRPVASIESYLQKVCLPLYGNTHTNISITGSQSTAFVAEARQIVAEETNAKITGKASLDVVLFA